MRVYAWGSLMRKPSFISDYCSISFKKDKRWMRSKMKLLLLIIAMSFNSLAKAEVKVDFRISKMHGFYDFLETISGKPHHTELILKAFKESTYNNSANEQWIKEIAAAEESMPGFEFNGFPKSRKSGADVELLFNVQSIFAKDLADFSSRTLGMMPIADHSRFFMAAQKLLPIYEKLIWNQALPELKKYREKLLQVSKKAKLDDLFLKAVKFYGAEWPQDQTFLIGLYPIPGKKGGTTSQSLGSAESVGVMASDRDYEGTFGVVFHELCHSLYGAQSLDLQYQLEKQFQTLNSKYASHAYSLLNEGLATALGNGYAEKMATGKLNDHQWYNNHYINGFSKAIYPLVEEYLLNGKTLDLEFVKKSTELLESTLPESLYDYDNLFQWLVVLQDGKITQRNITRNLFQNLFRVNRWSSHDPINGDGALDEASASDHTLMVIYSHAEMDQLKALSEKMPLVKEHLKELKSISENYIYSILDTHGRAFVFIQINKTADLVKAFEALKTVKKINLEKHFLVF